MFKYSPNCQSHFFSPNVSFDTLPVTIFDKLKGSQCLADNKEINLLKPPNLRPFFTKKRACQTIGSQKSNKNTQFSGGRMIENYTHSPGRTSFLDLRSTSRPCTRTSPPPSDTWPGTPPRPTCRGSGGSRRTAGRRRCTGRSRGSGTAGRGGIQKIYYF